MSTTFIYTSVNVLLRWCFLFFIKEAAFIFANRKYNLSAQMPSKNMLLETIHQNNRNTLKLYILYAFISFFILHLPARENIFFPDILFFTRDCIYFWKQLFLHSGDISPLTCPILRACQIKCHSVKQIWSRFFKAMLELGVYTSKIFILTSLESFTNWMITSIPQIHAYS